MTKLEAKLVKAALVWHVVTFLRGETRKLQKHERALRAAAIALLKKQDGKLTDARLKRALRGR